MDMEKPADAKSPIHELLRQRWSPRVFSPRPVSAETLKILFEAARWAPSSFNDQPWAYIVATKDDPEEFQRVLSTLVEGNRAWAQNAPVLMLSIAKSNFERTGQPNRHAFHDTGQATISLVIEATALGLAVHQMAGISAALLSDSIWFQLGRRKGVKILQFLCRISLEPDSCVRRTEGVFEKHGAKSLLIAKFVPGLNTAAPPLAGVFQMSRTRFLLFDALGAALWVGAFLGLGYVFANEIERVAGPALRLGGGLLAIVIAAFCGYIA